MSRHDDSSINYEQDTNLPMDENLPKDETSIKTGETNAPKSPVLNTCDIIDCTCIMLLHKNSQKFWFCIVKMIDDYEFVLAKYPSPTQFICSVNSNQYE